ncbi:MAG TPA: ArsR family transcriptional regulator [Bacteroidetes bacterium]|nr:ArsR family transcriptional regulator [Bacteroidota bacterium]
MSNHTCIRVFADPDHIAECQQRLLELETQMKSITNIIGLAGNEVRFKILFLLQDKGKQCVCDLSDILSMKIPAISQHLRKMKDGKLVTSNKVGATVFYQLTPGTLQVMQSLFDQVIRTQVEETP